MAGRESGTASYAPQRVLAGIIAALFTLYALMVLRFQFGRRLDPISATLGAVSGIVAVLCWWVALRAHIAESRARMKATLKGGIIVGGVGLAAGVLIPALTHPDANQGPLLGVFITGPLGFLVGSLAGYLYARLRVTPVQSARPQPERSPNEHGVF